MATRMYQIPQRQQEVMSLTAKGMNIEEVAVILEISPHTARKHRRYAVQSLDARNLAEAVSIFRAIQSEAMKAA